MLQGIDHIVVVAPDLQTAVANFTGLGFTVVPGGRHPTGTHNALVAFADSTYIELLAFYDPSGEHRWYELLQKGGGLIDFCAQTNNLDEDIQAFRRAGVALSDRAPLSRVRPDGYRLDWILSTPPDAQQGSVPFLIEDITPRSERIAKQTDHANHVTGVGTLTVAVNDLETVRQWYSSVLNTPGETIQRPDIQAHGVRFQFGPQVLDLVTTDNSESPVYAWLQQRGSSPYAVTFTANIDGVQELDPVQALNARITLIPSNVNGHR